MTQFATEVKLFGKWSFEDVEVKDMSLEDYIACRPKYAQFLPHSQGRWQKKRFRKAQCPIVERMVCSMMRYGRNNGKKVMALRIIKHAFEIVHLLTEQNPVQVYVEAVINCGPREDSTRVGGGGAVRRQACDVSPIRRVNTAIYLITTGAREASFRNIKTIAECLADEIMNAAKVRTSSTTTALKRPRRQAALLLLLLAVCAAPLCSPLVPLASRPPGLVEQLCHQEEGRDRARCQVQPLSGGRCAVCGGDVLLAGRRHQGACAHALLPVRCLRWRLGGVGERTLLLVCVAGTAHRAPKLEGGVCVDRVGGPRCSHRPSFVRRFGGGDRRVIVYIASFGAAKMYQPHTSHTFHANEQSQSSQTRNRHARTRPRARER